ncbi:MAG: hypothetical protein ACOC4E_01915 [Patescibacteria group bacterium]
MSNLIITHDKLQDALVVVSAKEQGKVFTTKDGTLRIVEYVAEHPESYSDDEGFFATVNTSNRLAGGAPKEANKQHNIDRYIKLISKELSDIIKREAPKRIFLFEPEHLKGLIVTHLQNPSHIPVETVAYGNFVEQDPQVVVDRLHAHVMPARDPADPASVIGEPRGEEKRKILSDNLEDER